MANCPQCGSSHITLKQGSDVNWGRALVGLAAFGVVGGAVGAVTGKDRDALFCCDCGATWRAADLHKVQQSIKEEMGIELDMMNEFDRRFCAEYIEKAVPCITRIPEAEKSAKSIVEFSKGVNLGLYTQLYSQIGFVVSCLIWYFTIVNSGNVSAALFFASFIPLIIGPILGKRKDLRRGTTKEQYIKKSEAQAAEIRLKAQQQKIDTIDALISKYNSRNSGPQPQ
jgi:hypothetical protein